jgi:hypothetical protein
MRLCKEIENCKPFECRDARCAIGDELRRISESKKCKGECLWMKTGINGINTCKDTSCQIGDTIVLFRRNMEKSIKLTKRG